MLWMTLRNYRDELDKRERAISKLQALIEKAHAELDLKERAVYEMERAAWERNAHDKLNETPEEAEAKRYLAGRPPMSGHYMGVPFDRFTAEEILKIWRECDGMFRYHQEPRTASPAPGRSSASDSEPDRAAGRRANRDIGDQGPSRG